MDKLKEARRLIDEYIEENEGTVLDPIEEPVEDEVETPEPDEEEIEETVKENPNDPLSNFRAVIINPTTVQCRWIANVEGEIDIEYYRPGIDRVWHHSVNKYLKLLIPISSESYNIGFNAPVETAYFRAKKARWKIFGLEFGVWYSNPVYAKKPEPVKEPEPKPEPVVEEPKPEIPKEPEPTKPDTVVQVAVTFLKGLSFDVWVNGIKLQDEFDYTFSVPRDYNAVNDRAGVKIIALDKLFETLVIDKNQTDVAIKVLNRDPENDLMKIDSRHDDTNPNFWGTPALNNHPLGIIYSKHGDTTQKEGEEIPDPLFYKGWREDPVNNPNNRDFHPQWSATGKIVISFMS